MPPQICRPRARRAAATTMSPHRRCDGGYRRLRLVGRADERGGPAPQAVECVPDLSPNYRSLFTGCGRAGGVRRVRGVELRDPPWFLRAGSTAHCAGVRQRHDDHRGRAAVGRQRRARAPEASAEPAGVGGRRRKSARETIERRPQQAPPVRARDRVPAPDSDCHRLDRTHGPSDCLSDDHGAAQRSGVNSRGRVSPGYVGQREAL